MGDYNPKSKGLPVTWRTLHRRLPKTLSTFQITILAGFLSLLILRSTIGMASFNFAGQYTSSVDEFPEETRLGGPDVDLLDVEPKRNLVQTADSEEEVEKIGRNIRRNPDSQLQEDEFDEQILEVKDKHAKGTAEVLPVPKPVKNVKETQEFTVVQKIVPELLVEDLPESTVVENFQEVEAELAEEETADELADFESFLKGEDGANATTLESNAVEETGDEEAPIDLKTTEENVDELKAVVENPVELKVEQHKSASEVLDEGGEIHNSTDVEGNVVRKAREIQELQQQAVVNMTKAMRRDDPNAFTLGPRIGDWDEQRAAWLERNPAMKTTDPHKPKVLLLTGSQPWPCNNSVGDHYLLKMIKNKVDYARIHKLEIFYNLAHLDKPMSHYWAKLPLIRKMMLIRPEVEWVFWMDSDAMFTDMVFEVPFEKYENYNLVMWGYDEGIYNERSWVACNTGVFFLRNNQWTLDLLESWSHMGSEGVIRNETGKIFTSYLTNRPDMTADDQSALVYLMLTNPELRPKILLEDDYWLSGYWASLVGQYEQFLEKSRPGAGGRNWPFTTHFTGCQPCTGLNNELYEANSCLDGMEKAFNFADNQVLRPFGFEHESLQGSKVRRIRNETTQPILTVPIDNPWAVNSFY